MKNYRKNVKFLRKLRNNVEKSISMQSVGTNPSFGRFVQILNLGYEIKQDLRPLKIFARHTFSIYRNPRFTLKTVQNEEKRFYKGEKST